MSTSVLVSLLPLRSLSPFFFPVLSFSHSVMSNSFCDSVDHSPPGSSVHGILQARVLEWVPISSSGNLPDPGIEPVSSAWQADSFPLNHQGSPSPCLLVFFCLPIFCVVQFITPSQYYASVLDRIHYPRKSSAMKPSQTAHLTPFLPPTGTFLFFFFNISKQFLNVVLFLPYNSANHLQLY